MMSEIMKKSTTVTELNIHSEKKRKRKTKKKSEVNELLTDNVMGDEGVYLLRDALTVNTTLALLGLEGI